MRPFRFDLKTAFVIVSNVCVVAWAIANVGKGYYAGLVAIIVTAFVFAIFGKSQKRSSQFLGKVGGFLGAVTVGLGAYVLDLKEYFKDGVLALVIYAMLILVVWGLIGAFVGWLCGGLVRMICVRHSNSLRD
jgi:fluoride ion exporter CrcB/FEX